MGDGRRGGRPRGRLRDPAGVQGECPPSDTLARAAPLTTHHLQNEPTTDNAFLDQWRKAVGDTFEDKVAISLLSVRPRVRVCAPTYSCPHRLHALVGGGQGNYLTSIDSLSTPPKTLLTYFPSSELPVDPGARFAELFLARPRWKTDEIAPFLADIAVDAKERDKLLLKHARALTDAEGIWYTGRAKYNG